MTEITECSCNNKVEYTFEQQNVCKNCFLRLFKNRIKRALSEKKLRKDSIVLIENECAAQLVKEIIPLPLRIVSKANTYDAQIVTDTLDDEAIDFLEQLPSTDEKNVIKIFKYVSENEVIQYATIKRYKFTPKPKNKFWKEFLDAFKKYPDMQNNLVRNIQELKKLKK